MHNAVMVFVSGLGGVFLGITLLYASIRITSWVAKRLVVRKEEK